MDPMMGAAARQHASRDGIPPGTSSGANFFVPKWKPSDTIILKCLTAGKMDPFRMFYRTPNSKRKILASTWERLGLTKFAEMDFRGQPRATIVSYILQLEIDEQGRVGGVNLFSGRAYHRTHDQLCNIFGFRSVPMKEPDWVAIEDQKDDQEWRQMLQETTGGKEITNSGIRVADFSEVFSNWLAWSLRWLHGKKQSSRCSVVDVNIAWELYTGRLHPLSLLIRTLKGGVRGNNEACTAMATCIFAHAMGHFITPVTPRQVGLWGDREEHEHVTKSNSKRRRGEFKESTIPGQKQAPSWEEFQFAKIYRKRGADDERLQKRASSGQKHNMYDLDDSTGNAEQCTGMAFDWARGSLSPRTERQDSPAFVGRCKSETMEAQDDAAGLDAPRSVEPGFVNNGGPVPGPPMPWGPLTIEKIWEKFKLERRSRVLAEAERDEMKNRLEFWKSRYKLDC